MSYEVLVTYEGNRQCAVEHAPTRQTLQVGPGGGPKITPIDLFVSGLGS